MGLIDGLQRPEPHRNCRELPEVRHQPWMRIGRETFAIDLPTEVIELRFIQPTLEVGARVDAGRAVALDVYQVAIALCGGRVEEVVETNVVQRCTGGKTGDVPAE